MLDIEKMAARARVVLLGISLMGAAIAAGSATVAVIIVMRTSSLQGGDWLAGIQNASGPITMAAVGFLITCMPFAVGQVVMILLRRAHDDRYHRDQLMGSLDAQTKILEVLRDVNTLSDAAKQVAYRAKDLEALRAAIREDLSRNDFEAATMLVNEMERRFGYPLEVDSIREEINQKNRSQIDQRVNDTIEHVELLLTRYDWAEATRESERLLRLFPMHQNARRLPSRIHQARDDHKRQLLKMWKEAVAKDDVDRSVELLRELDQYLSSSEGAAYKEAARDVFRKKLQQLGVQFALHVHDRSWLEALRIGRQITDEFPNTRMAQEVRERLPILEEKAQLPVGA